MGSAPFDEARWLHDCQECKFLGGYGDFDLYYCRQEGRPTVIARFGSDDGDFLSGLGAPAWALREAKRRSVARGFLQAEAA